MKTTIEISLYPFHQNYKNQVLDFLEQLNQHDQITVETNGMSTQIFGDYATVMAVLTNEMQAILAEQSAIFVLKIAKGMLRYKS